VYENIKEKIPPSKSIILNWPFSSISVYDASVKVPVGIEYGNTFQFGNFDQCLSVKTKRSFAPKYCLAMVNVPGYQIREISTRHQQVSH
jgi:Nose resistant-to-fluoxetine protein, N-terminal domain